MRLRTTIAILFGIGLSLPGGCPPNTAPADLTPVQSDLSGIYVTTGNSVAVFALDASGNAAPKRVISGVSTGMSLPIGVASDTQNNLYVANRTGSTVTVYPLGADGDTTPTRTLTAAGMGSPEGLAVGPGDDLFVATCPTCGSGGGGESGIFHFSNNALTSDFKIGGTTNTNTGFTGPASIALDENRNLFVANVFGGNVQVFPPGASGDTLPIRSFSPGASLNVQAMAYGNNAVFLSVPGGVINQYVATVTGNVTPSSAITSSSISVQYPAGIAVDTSVTPPVIYLADYFGDAILVIQTAGIAPFLTVSNVTTISGSATGLDGPLGLLVVK
ncbi:MAG: hypothetical protein U1D55_00800 [Phycisphaerae bacterium]